MQKIEKETLTFSNELGEILLHKLVLTVFQQMTKNTIYCQIFHDKTSN